MRGASMLNASGTRWRSACSSGAYIRSRCGNCAGRRSVALRRPGSVDLSPLSRKTNAIPKVPSLQRSGRPLGHAGVVGANPSREHDAWAMRGRDRVHQQRRRQGLGRPPPARLRVAMAAAPGNMENGALTQARFRAMSCRWRTSGLGWPDGRIAGDTTPTNGHQAGRVFRNLSEIGP